MEWGAAELFRATRNTRYLRDAKRYALLAGAESWMGKDEAGHYQYYPFMNIGHFRLYDLVDTRTKKQLARLTTTISMITRRTNRRWMERRRRFSCGV